MNIDVVYIKKAIKDIENLNRDLGRLDRRATPDIVGFYGELLVWKELKTRFGWQGYKIELGQGQSRADIVMRKKERKINVEIKTSRLKKEWHGEGYGFALNMKKCKRHDGLIFDHPKKGEINGCFCYFDYLVAVLLSDDFKKKEFYIFPRTFVEKNEKLLRNQDKRFSSATHRMVFLRNPSDSNLITDFDRDLAKNESKYRDKWLTIK